MLEFEAAVARMLEAAPRLAAESVELGEADGRVLAETIVAAAPLPPFDYSAMDGYAVRVSDFARAGPWTLPVAGESRTGRGAPGLEPASACRIFTGAPLPAGADAVVMQENVERDGNRARFASRPAAGDNVRNAGEDLRPGAVALEAGTRLGPQHVGLIAALDRARVSVALRPRVVVICTGDELRAPGSAGRPGSIPESNGPAIAALARRAGARVAIAALAGDDRDATRHAVARALTDCDLLVTIGGVSVGDHDVVRPALEAAGVRLDFWKVRIKPGKPLVHGVAGDARVLGLPGNPASAQVTFVLFGMPLLRAMQGDHQPRPPLRRATLDAPLTHSPGRLGFYRVRLAGERATPFGNQASGATTNMAWSNALALVPEASQGIAAGERVDVIAFDEL
jgi:molybdopterin molybdotransferase